MIRNIEDFLKIGKLYQFKKTPLDKELVFYNNHQISGEIINITQNDVVLILNIEIDYSDPKWKFYSLKVLNGNKILSRTFSETSIFESKLLYTLHLID